MTGDCVLSEAVPMTAAVHAAPRPAWPGAGPSHGQKSALKQQVQHEAVFISKC